LQQTQHMYAAVTAAITTSMATTMMTIIMMLSLLDATGGGVALVVTSSAFVGAKSMPAIIAAVLILDTNPLSPVSARNSFKALDS